MFPHIKRLLGSEWKQPREGKGQVEHSGEERGTRAARWRAVINTSSTERALRAGANTAPLCPLFPLWNIHSLHFSIVGPCCGITSWTDNPHRNLNMSYWSLRHINCMRILQGLVQIIIFRDFWSSVSIWSVSSSCLCLTNLYSLVILSPWGAVVGVRCSCIQMVQTCFLPGTS